MGRNDMSMRVLVVDDQEDIREIMTLELNNAGYHAESYESAPAALTALEKSRWDVVLTDLRMPGMDGMQFLKEIKSRDADMAVILITAHGTVNLAVDAMRDGASDFLLKPFDFNQLKVRLDRVAETRHLRREVERLRKTSASTEIVAESPSMKLLLERVKKAATSKATVLILGESGTGKECIALKLFEQSTDAKKAFVARNCAAIPENLFESEMFGHKKGSFTGADKDRRGAFVEADGGTLFLDEIGDLSYMLQTKLLRAIQENVVHPAGSDKDVPVNVRIICATNKDLRESCRNHSFREDLYYRLATVTIQVPPLRERIEDIIPLARYFVRFLSSGTRTLSAASEDRLQNYNWPGNVRELRSAIEQGIIFSAGNEIQPDELGLQGQLPEHSSASQSLADAERRHILQVLHTVNGNKTEAARVLKMARSTLLVKLQSYEKNKFDRK
jgi:DNA-binding NtrC family response regulator